MIFIFRDNQSSPEKGEVEEKFDPFLSVCPYKSRPSIIVKQLDVVNPTVSISSIEKFAQDLKFNCPNLFKDIKSFINKRTSPPFSGEVEKYKIDYYY